LPPILRNIYRTMTMHKLMIAALSSAALLMPSVLPAAQNGHPFADWQQSRVNYRDTPYEGKSSCAAAWIPVAQGVVIQSSVLVPSTGDVPAHCRVDGTITGDIGFRLALPLKWNGRLYMYGNGGFSGEDADGPRELTSVAAGLSNGFAVVRTDTGHLASREPAASFASNPGKMIDHAYLAVHESIQFAKQAVIAFYGRQASKTYWQGCSTGGRQGVMSAQRYPDDFDGIAAAAPTLDWNNIMIKGLWTRLAFQGAGLTVGKMHTVFGAVMKKCDAVDGLKDGLIDDPRQCRFDPVKDVPHCTSTDTDSCLTDKQVDGLQRIYAGPKDSSGKPLFHSQSVGFENIATMAPFIAQPDGGNGLLSQMADSWMKYIIFGSKDYDTATYNFDLDPARGAAINSIMNPKPDLAAFEARGGKMLTYWGWSDTALNPQMGIAYYEKLENLYGADKLRSFYKLFMIPGVAHCEGGYGPGTIDALTPVIDWVEQGIAPQRLFARSAPQSQNPYTRAYCAFPERTRYKGKGDANDPANFECVPATR
jgi:feruloyl esterase